MNRLFFISILLAASVACVPNQKGPVTSRISMFVGMDISGSFVNGKYFSDSLRFLAYYIYIHLRGEGGAVIPRTLFVGSIGGSKPNEPKTFFPIQIFQDKTVDEIHKKLKDIFPRKSRNPYTDFNAFFKQIATTVKQKKLILRPISIVLISDGVPDFPKKHGKLNFKRIDVAPLEQLSRNITVRLLYTNPVVGMGWQTKVPRKRVKIWTQDAAVMEYWKDPKIMYRGRPLSKQKKFFGWLKDNVDFGVRSVRID